MLLVAKGKLESEGTERESLLNAAVEEVLCRMGESCGAD